MAVIVTRVNNDLSVTAITFGDSNDYLIDSGVCTVTQDGARRASFRDWREVVIADESEVEDVLAALELSPPDAAGKAADHDGR